MVTHRPAKSRLLVKGYARSSRASVAYSPFVYRLVQKTLTLLGVVRLHQGLLILEVYMEELKQLIIHACENWLKENPHPNDWLPLSRESVEELLMVLKHEGE